MAGTVTGRPAKIRGLARLLSDGERGQAIRYDLIRLGGWTKRDIGPVLGWEEVELIAKNLPYDDKSALYRHEHPDDYWFGMPEQFQAAILHSIQSGNWQRGGGKGSRPEMFKPRKKADVIKESVPVDNVKDELARRRAAAQRRKAREAAKLKVVS